MDFLVVGGRSARGVRAVDEVAEDEPRRLEKKPVDGLVVLGGFEDSSSLDLVKSSMATEEVKGGHFPSNTCKLPKIAEIVVS